MGHEWKNFAEDLGRPQWWCRKCHRYAQSTHEPDENLLIRVDRTLTERNDLTCDEIQVLHVMES